MDVYTIQQEVGHLNNLKIGLVGDLANGRTVRSLAYLLSMYDNVKMYFVAPDVVRMKDDIKEFLTGRQVLYHPVCCWAYTVWDVHSGHYQELLCRRMCNDRTIAVMHLTCQ